MILNELSSVIGNYYETKGLKLKWRNIWNFIIGLFGKKTNIDTSGVDVGDFVEPIQRPRDAKGRFVKKS